MLTCIYQQGMIYKMLCLSSSKVLFSVFLLACPTHRDFSLHNNRPMGIVHVYSLAMMSWCTTALFHHLSLLSIFQDRFEFRKFQHNLEEADWVPVSSTTLQLIKPHPNSHLLSISTNGRCSIIFELIIMRTPLFSGDLFITLVLLKDTSEGNHCIMWFYLANLIMAILITVLLFLVVRRYKGWVVLSS